MDEELPKLKISPSFKRIFDSTISLSSEDSSSDIEDHRYTSLKDIIFSTLPQHAVNNDPSNAFDSSNISIRNELVKHAASAYVQSAAILVNRDQDLISRFWEKMKITCVGFLSCWHTCVRVPLRAIFHPVLHFLYRSVDRIRSAYINQ